MVTEAMDLSCLRHSMKAIEHQTSTDAAQVGTSHMWDEQMGLNDNYYGLGLQLDQTTRMTLPGSKPHTKIHTGAMCLHTTF